MERTSIVGIGSPHGDDQAGWLVIDLLENSSCRSARLFRAKVPHDVLDYMDDCDELHLVDCFHALTMQMPTLRLDLVVNSEIVDTIQSLLDSETAGARVTEPIQSSPYLRSQGTHQLDVATVLQLAETLDRLPRNVTLWAVPGLQFSPHSLVSDSCCLAIAECSRRILDHLRSKQP